jgi:hypothetical protein
MQFIDFCFSGPVKEGYYTRRILKAIGDPHGHYHLPG